MFSCCNLGKDAASYKVNDTFDGDALEVSCSVY